MNSPAGILQTLLASAASDVDARNQALGLLRRATLYACTWPTDAVLVRTLTSSDGVTAMPLFTDVAQLDAAARRFGWLAADGSIPQRSLSITQAVNLTRTNGATVIVLDIVADHAMELDQGDFEIVAAASSTSRRPPSMKGLSPIVPGARTSAPPSKASQTALRPASAPPPALDAARAAKADHEGFPDRRSQSHLNPVSVAPHAPASTVSATFGGSGSAGIEALGEEVSDELLEALAAVLRGYPEVEWGCLLRATRAGTTQKAPAVGLRVDAQFRVNLNEISVQLREKGTRFGASLDVLLLDEPDMIRDARMLGTHFYPWKKRPSSIPG